ncbi:MAG: EAL domain-containing protein [Rhodocyclaceae bacterium]|nr:EAL domain-containing protein [Rhodocyclaceae bacterium]
MRRAAAIGATRRRLMSFVPPPMAPEQSPEIPRAIARLAFVGGTLVTLLVPMIFLAIGYQGESARLEAALRVTAPGISSQLQARPHGNGSAHSLPDLLASLAWLGDDTRIRIVGSEAVPLVDKNRDPPPPLLTRTAFLDHEGEGPWRLELSRSLRPLLLFALAMFAPGLLLGWVTYLALKDVPMRAFRLALQEIAVRKTTEERLAKSLSIFSATLESTADGIFVTDVHGRGVVANQRFIDLWKLPKSACTGGFDGQTLQALTDQLRDSAAFVSTQKDLTKHIDVDHGAVLELRDGRLFEWNSRPQYIDGTVVGRVSSFRDISQRKRAEVLLTAEKEVLEMVVCGSPLKAALGVLARHVEVLSGQMFCAILFREHGAECMPTYATGPSLPSTLFDGIVQNGQAALEAIFADVRSREDPEAHGLSDEFSGVIEDVASNPAWSEYRDMMASLDIKTCFAVSVQSSTGSQLGLIVAHYRKLSDQTPHDRELIWVAAHLTSIAIERRQAETRLRLLAHYDPLTLLPNRDLFRDRLSHALTHAERHRGMVAVMFLDLDRFKTVNDTLGHDAGDQLLTEVSARLKRCVREEDTVARLGGDEFTVILEQIARPGDAAVVAAKIVEALAPPVDLDGYEAFVTPSIGITIYPADSANAENLLKNADTAMYRVKEQGGNGYLFFTPEMNTQAAGRLQLESGLRRALERDEFVVYYQPKVDLASETIVGAEALLRWNHPERGMVSPGEFIPILEETGMIEQVGIWVLRTVCRQMRAWQEAGMPPLTVAVNLSGRQLQRANLAATIAGILEETGLPPRFLELEVTESILMRDPSYAASMLEQIRATGVVHIDVDDFGTGYSSLSYLKRFPIDALKLDKSFVDGLPSDEDDIAIARAVIALAHSLKLAVIAEGVETEEQLAFLQQNECDVIQGYLVSRPLPAADFAQMVREREHLDDWFAAQFDRRRPPLPRRDVARIRGYA